MYYVFRLPFVHSHKKQPSRKAPHAQGGKRNRLFQSSFFLFLLGVSMGAFGLYSIYSHQAAPQDTPTMEPVLQTTPKTVYLTFDDGPSKNTPHLLEVLKKHNVKATFFQIGPVESVEDSYSKLLLQIQKDGHTIAPHSFSHDYSIIYPSADAFLTDFRQIQNLIQTITGSDSKIYRFPGGSRNRGASPSVIDQVIATLAAEGYQYHDWDIVSGDDTAVVYSPETLYQNVMAEIEKYDNPVILFHDTDLTRTTADAVDLLITELTSQGYIFAPITKDTPPLQFSRG